MNHFERLKQSLKNQPVSGVIHNAQDKQSKSIQTQRDKMQGMLTGNKTVDSVITTPQEQWSPYQIAVANLNPDLKKKSRDYQTASRKMNVLENEKVNLDKANEFMQEAYNSAIQKMENSRDGIMAANSANAQIQAGGAISGLGSLATNPAAAAQTRLSAQNTANAQNMQVSANTDSAIGSISAQKAQIPTALSSMEAQKRQGDLQERQLDLQEKQLSQKNSYGGHRTAGYVQQMPKGQQTDNTSQKWDIVKDVINTIWDAKRAAEGLSSGNPVGIMTWAAALTNLYNTYKKYKKS